MIIFTMHTRPMTLIHRVVNKIRFLENVNINDNSIYKNGTGWHNNVHWITSVMVLSERFVYHSERFSARNHYYITHNIMRTLPQNLQYNAISQYQLLSHGDKTSSVYNINIILNYGIFLMFLHHTARLTRIALNFELLGIVYLSLW